MDAENHLDYEAFKCGQVRSIRSRAVNTDEKTEFRRLKEMNK